MEGNAVFVFIFWNVYELNVFFWYLRLFLILVGVIFFRYKRILCRVIDMYYRNTFYAGSLLSFTTTKKKPLSHHIRVN